MNNDKPNTYDGSDVLKHIYIMLNLKQQLIIQSVQSNFNEKYRLFRPMDRNIKPWKI